MANWQALLNKSFDDIEAPKPLPAGSWTFKVSLKFKEPKTDDDDPYVQGIFAPVEPGPDVDQAEVDAFGDFSGEKVFQRFWLRDKRDEFRLKELIGMCGVDTRGKSIAQGVGEVQDYLLTALVDHEPKKDDPEVIYNRLSRFAPAA